MQVGTPAERLPVPRLQGSSTTYEHFLHNHLRGNKPCLLSPSLVQHWPAFQDWIGPESSARLEEGHLSASFSRLAECYAGQVVPVAISTISSGDEEDEEERSEMEVRQAVALMAEAKRSNLARRVYIKDWHLIRMQRQRRARGESVKVPEPYEVPLLFADDWMNNCKNTEDDDFRFCYAGSAGTQTMLHRDDTSYSWSTNVVGTKRWRLFPPSAKAHLRKFPSVSTSPMAVSVDELEKLSEQGRLGPVKVGQAGWPEWPLAMQLCHEVIQKEGETIFVPSDWYHEVFNLTDCISINHNWCNSTNIASMYWSMCEEVAQVEEAMSDVRELMQGQDPGWRKEWTDCVQTVLATNSGWGWQGFWQMVQHNLDRHACAAPIRPSQGYVASELLPCLADFQQRPEYGLVSEETREAHQKSASLLAVGIT